MKMEGVLTVDKKKRFNFTPIYSTEVTFNNVNDLEFEDDMTDAEIQAVMDKSSVPTKFVSGYDLFDERFYGFGKEDLVIIAGQSGIGKTFFATNLAGRMARLGKMIYIPFEGESDQIQAQLRLAYEDNYKKYDPLDRTIQVASQKQTKQIYSDIVSYTNIIESAIVHGAKFVFVDLLNSVLDRATGNNIQESQRQALHGLYVLASKYQCSIVVVAHTNKQTVAGKLIQRGDIYGTVGIVGSATGILLLDSNPETGELGVRVDKRRDRPPHRFDIVSFERVDGVLRPRGVHTQPVKALEGWS